MDNIKSRAIIPLIRADKSLETYKRTFQKEDEGCENRQLTMSRRIQRKATVIQGQLANWLDVGPTTPPC